MIAKLHSARSRVWAVSCRRMRSDHVSCSFWPSRRPCSRQSVDCAWSSPHKQALTMLRGCFRRRTSPSEPGAGVPNRRSRPETELASVSLTLLPNGESAQWQRQKGQPISSSTALRSSSRVVHGPLQGCRPHRKLNWLPLTGRS